MKSTLALTQAAPMIDRASEFAVLRELQRTLRLYEIAFEVPAALYRLRRDVLRRMGVLAQALAVACVVLVFIPMFADAHDSWISKGGLKNGAGEWCCGEGDCPALNYTPRVTSSGYQLEGGEVVPFSEAQPSPDGSYVRCHRPDGTRRCFFAPQPSN